MTSNITSKNDKSSGYITGKLNDTNSILQEENRCLKSQLELLKENSDLKSATLITVLASWISGKRLNITNENTEDLPRNTPPVPCQNVSQRDEITFECMSTSQLMKKAQQPPCKIHSITVNQPYEKEFRPEIYSTPKKNIHTEPVGSNLHNSYPRRLSEASTSTEDAPPIDMRPLSQNDFSSKTCSISDQFMTSSARDREIKSRIIGEIAFQLDRRIVSYIFRTGDESNKRRFYGYSLLTMATLIDVEAGTNLLLRQNFIDRLRKLVTFLAPLGFDIEYHPARLVATVNKFGRLNITNRTPETTEPFLEEAQFNNLLDDLQLEQTDRFDMLIFLAGLRAMSRIDGLPLFIY